MINLKIATWNICLGMFHKIQIIKNIIYSENLDLLLLNETELTENHDQQFLKITGYDLITPMNRTTTRIAGYIKSNLDYEICQSNQRLETISVKISNLKILGVYRGFKIPHHGNFTENMIDLVAEVNNHDVILGDFNLDSNKKGLSSYRFSNINNLWQNEIDAKGFTQINYENTWTRTVNGQIQESCLDHIYIKDTIGDTEFSQKTRRATMTSSF